jgi:hypothetical protein
MQQKPRGMAKPPGVSARRWHFLLHNQTALPLKWALLYRRHRHGGERAVIDMPFHLQH